MATKIKTAETRVKLGTPQLPAGIRSGGEKRPMEYPHLYQIQAGDWRISYAVEHNRLAILVLEVLNADGGSSKDPVQENLTKKMKVKLLDWPEGAGNQQLPPEEISKKLKIKWLDLAEDGDDNQAANARGTSRVKLKPLGQHKITLVGPVIDAVADPAEEADPADEANPPSDDLNDQDRKVTPVDEPSM